MEWFGAQRGETQDQANQATDSSQNTRPTNNVGQISAGTLQELLAAFESDDSEEEEEEEERGRLDEKGDDSIEENKWDPIEEFLDQVTGESLRDQHHLSIMLEHWDWHRRVAR